ncbi:MAG: hypothetical protein ABL882_11595 [Sphingopyxis sp.]
MSKLLILIWFATVIGLGLWSAFLGFAEMRTGRAKILAWPEFTRSHNPTQFWLAIAGRGLGVIGSVALLVVFRVWS